MNYRNVLRALSVKHSYMVLREIHQGCINANFMSFDDLRKKLNINKSTLRRITNRLSACGLIKSIKNDLQNDGRKRVFVPTDIHLVSILSDVIEYMSR